MFLAAMIIKPLIAFVLFAVVALIAKGILSRLPDGRIRRILSYSVPHRDKAD